MSSIQIEDLCKDYGGSVPALSHLSLSIDDQSFVTLLGPSGCGKTTTLRLIAGFLKPDHGRIWTGADLLSSPQAVVQPERRGMGMVFQNYAVWPHKTVFDNVAFGLSVRRVDKVETRRRVLEMLEAVHLGGLQDRYPNQLSGGQQQRVALARSLVVEPRILLLDEPLSNLDAKLREQMRWELKALQRRTGITFVYVTHDQAEAMALSDRIAVMHNGELQQFGTPREVYTQPANRTVADFMGVVNLLPVRAVRDAMGEAVLLDAYRLPLALPAGVATGTELQLAVRPEMVTIEQRNGGCSHACLPARVEEATYLGASYDCFISLGSGARLRVQAPSNVTLEPGEPVCARIDSGRCTLVE